MPPPDDEALLRPFAGRRRLESLDALFAPRSIAIVGASQDARKIGGRPLAFLKRYGYPGAIYPVNPQYPEVQGVPAFSSLGACPSPPEQVIVALPAQKVPAVVAEAAAIGAKTAVVFSSGFGEAGPEGKALQQRLVAVIGDGGLRVLGPNCIGVMNVRERSYGTFQLALESGNAPSGSIGVAVQSGAMGSHLLTLCRNAGIGLGCWAATGNEADIDVADVIAWMARDPGTRVIMCCLEACGDAARFRAALALARAGGKPVLVLKIGASDVARRPPRRTPACSPATMPCSMQCSARRGRSASSRWKRWSKSRTLPITPRSADFPRSAQHADASASSRCRAAPAC